MKAELDYSKMPGFKTIVKTWMTRIETGVTYCRKSLPLLLAGVFLLVAIYGYHGSNRWLLGPPFGNMIGQDFRQILRASREIAQGENLYQHAISFASAPNFAEFMWWEASPYPYSPLPGVLATPLLGLKVESALALWTVVSWLLLLGSVIMATSIFSGATRTEYVQNLVFLVVLFLVYGPTHIHLKLGQLDILLLFLLLLTYLLYRRGRNIAGLPLGLAIAIKPILGPMVAFFIWKRQWRLAINTVITAALLTAASFFVVGWERLPDYIQVLHLWSTSAMLSYPFNQSVNGLTLRLFTLNAYIQPVYAAPWLANLVRIGAGLLAIAAWLLAVPRADNRANLRSGVEYALTLTTTLFLTPLVDDVHFVWVLLPIVGLLLPLMTDLHGSKKRVLFVIALFVTVYLAYPDLHDAIYIGWDSLAYNGVLVDRSNAFFTNAYLYGLVGLETCLAAFLFLTRARNVQKTPKWQI